MRRESTPTNREAISQQLKTNLAAIRTAFENIITQDPSKDINQLTRDEVQDSDRKALLENLGEIAALRNGSTKGFPPRERKPLTEFRKHHKPFIEIQLKPDLIEDLNAHPETQAPNRALARLLGLDSDPQVSSLLAPASKSRRLLMRTGLSLIGAGLFTKGAKSALSIYRGGSEKIAAPVRARTLNPSTPIPREAPQIIPLPSDTATPEATLTPTAQPTATKTPESSPTLGASPTSSPSPDTKILPTSIATSTPETQSAPEEPEENPTGNESSENLVEVGDKNFLEFFLEERVKSYIQRAEREAQNDPSYAERVPEKSRKSKKITLLMMGTDETRDEGRMNVFSHGQGWGRSDVVKIVVIDPSAQSINIINPSRDLFSPDVYNENITFGNDPQWDKVNAATMMSFVRIAGKDPTFPFKKTPRFKPDALPDSMTFAKKMWETATGLRIDGILQSNIDFIRGSRFYQHNGIDYPARPGFLDLLCPNGLTITPQESFQDQYGVRFNKGETQVMHARKATEFARSRGDTEDNRVKRQNQVMYAVLSALAPEFAGLFSKDLEGSMKSTPAIKNLFRDSVDRENLLQVMIDGFREQSNIGNFFQHTPNPDYFDLIEFLESTNQFVADMHAHPHGGDILSRLAFNSKGGLLGLFLNKQGTFKEHYISKSAGIAEGHAVTTIRLKGSDPFAPPTRLGNYMATWRPLRTLTEGWIK